MEARACQRVGVDAGELPVSESSVRFVPAAPRRRLWRCSTFTIMPILACAQSRAHCERAYGDGFHEGVAVLNYLAIMLRWKWLIGGVMTLCLGAGIAYLMTTTPLYRASATLLYVQPVTISNPLIQSSYLQT